MFRIKQIQAREILDSRGWPTVEVEVKLDNNRKAWASVPAGVSTGKYEARELRDNDQKRYFGKGVKKAVFNVNQIIARKLIGKDPYDQEELDQLMIKADNTRNKSKLGANAILGVSLAIARSAAIAQNLPLYQHLRRKFFPKLKEWQLPQPMFNILNGGRHANFAIDFQEFMIVPQQNKVNERIRSAVEIFKTLGEILKKRGLAVLVGDEGGYAPRLRNNEEAIKLICQAIKTAGYNFQKVKIALDVAASEIYQKDKKTYQLKLEKKNLTAQKLIDYYQELIKKYPLISLEDGLAEDDWLNWQKLTKILGKKIKLVGDDLFVTNSQRLRRGLKEKVANTILIKPNQIGTLTETIDCIKLAKDNNYKVIISHRSGETNDDFIVDLAVAANADYLKAGSLTRGERIMKYNRLTEIEEELN